jgi:hypothetical protein
MLHIYFLDHPDMEQREHKVYDFAVARTPEEASELIYQYFCGEWEQPDRKHFRYMKEATVSRELLKQFEYPMYLGYVNKKSDIEQKVCDILEYMNEGG